MEVSLGQPVVSAVPAKHPSAFLSVRFWGLSGQGMLHLSWDCFRDSLEKHRFELVFTSGPERSAHPVRRQIRKTLLRKWSAYLRMAAAGLWITLGREACQPGLRYSNQYCVCSLWGLRWEEEIFGKFQLLLVQGMLPERQVYCMFLPETNPDFKKWEWCFIYFCILQQSGFLK